MEDIPSASSFSAVHFVGIGGAGMSGIALVLHQRGCRVTGSDVKVSRYVRDLEDAGISVHVGHAADTIDQEKPEVVVISSAIPDENVEVVRARELGIPVWPRAKMLSALSLDATTVAVAGTHGKTTTSSMVATMLDHLGWDPSFLIGGVVEEYGTNGRNGKGGYFVCEADESDGSFLFLRPSVVVVTNIEADHLDHYGTLENIERTFCEFMDLVGDAGTIVIYGDVPHYVELARSTGRTVVTYGLEEGNDFVCVPGESTGDITNRFAVRCPSGEEVAVTLTANPGKHNMANGCACIAVAATLGADVTKAAEALSTFKGAHRRFTHVGDIDGITVVDDYGHHPTEIKATLTAARELSYDRIVCVFQPHRYSRTKALAEGFGTAFDLADKLVVMDVFSAGEMPIPGVSGKTVALSVREGGKVPDVTYISNRKDVIRHLCETCKPGDLLITQGAGDVTAIGPAFIAARSEMDAKGDGRA